MLRPFSFIPRRRANCLIFCSPLTSQFAFSPDSYTKQADTGQEHCRGFGNRTDKKKIYALAAHFPVLQEEVGF